MINPLAYLLGPFIGVLPALVLGWLLSLLCGIHAVRNGRSMMWLWILIIAPGLGAAIYFFAEIMPGLGGGRAARQMGKAARAALDPARDYREARRALEETPSVGNRMRLAQAAGALGRWQEAEADWAQCAAGQYADDPAILMGWARALLELGRYEDALARLETLRALGREGETPQAALAFARAYEGLGRLEEAEAPYRFAADRVPGLEAAARYAAFLAKAGRPEEARAQFAEIERRFARIAGPLKAEARPWRDLAAQAAGGARP
ncbi:MAG: hypothetical protein AB7L65_06465 [Hyphomonadaceae bacterium]